MESLIGPFFLSYSEEDAVIARRIHEALRRAKAQVWGYKEDGRYGVDYEEEFTNKIRASRFFCLLDGPHARASSWIRKECQLARRVGAIMVICRIGPMTGENWGPELFEKQELIRAIDFQSFDSGIREMFRHVGIAYSPGSSIPRDQNFEDELQKSGLSVERFQELLDLYREFREQCLDPDYAQSQLRIVIKKCRLYGANDVTSPILALGILEGNAGNHKGAHLTFKSLTESHPKDPRGWAGMGAACFHLGRLEEALHALDRSLEMIVRFYKEESGPHIPEVTYNVASVLLLMGRADHAAETLRRLTAKERKLPYVQALEGRLLLHAGKPRAALPFLLDAYREAADVLDFQPSLIMDLANCYRGLGDTRSEIHLLEEATQNLASNPGICHRAAECFLRNGMILQAISALRNATNMTPASPLYRAQLAAVLWERGGKEQQEALDLAKFCVNSGLTPEERYYRGLAYYLLGKNNSADDDFEESRKSPVVRNWPHYRNLLSRNS